MRRTLIIIAAIVVLIGIALAVYFFFFANKGTISVGEPTNPFGSADDRDGTLTPVTDAGVPVQGAGTQVAPKFIKITDGPVAYGVASIYYPPKTTTVGTTTASSTPQETIITPEESEVRYIDRQSGNIYSFRMHERTLTRLSNKTLPGIQEAAWLTDGSAAFVRFLEKASDATEHVSTYLLPISGEGGYFLEQDIAEVSTASSSVLVLLSGSSGSVGSLRDATGRGGKTVFTTTLASLHASFAGATYIATTKASLNLDGYSFIASATGFTRLLGPLRGLMALPSPNGSSMLYSYVDRGKLYTQVLDVTNRSTTVLPLATLPEKCVWTRNSQTVYCGVPTALVGALPDDWLQGVRPFSDRIWKIDLATREASLIVDPRTVADVDIDAVALSLDSANDVLTFTNRIDGSLWAYDL